MARVYGKNPIDPVTGKPRRGRPPKVQPVDTISGSEPQEQAVGGKVKVTHLNPKEDVSTELGTLWRKRMSSTELMAVPDEIKKQYPDGSFCWAQDSKECIAKYRTRFGYEIVETTKPLPGQTDTAFRFGDAILMVRPRELEKIHREVDREKVLAQTSNKSADEIMAEREALQAAQQAGYDGRSRNLSFFTEDQTEKPELAHEEQLALAKEVYALDERRPKGASGRGSKYWGGGIPK